MKLASLLREIDRSAGAVTVGELAARLDTTPGVIGEMLTALRASGRLGPEGSNLPGTHECASTGTCGISCSGPSDCPFTVDLGPTLEIKRR